LIKILARRVQIQGWQITTHLAVVYVDSGMLWDVNVFEDFALIASVEEETAITMGA